MATVSVVRNAQHCTLETQNKKHCSTLVYNMLEERERGVVLNSILLFLTEKSSDSNKVLRWSY